MATQKKDTASVKKVPKKPKQKAPKTQKSKSFWSYFGPLLFVFTTIPFVMVFLAFTQRIEPDSLKAFNEKNDLVLNLFRSQVALELDGLTAKLSAMTKDKSFQESIQDNTKPFLMAKQMGNDSIIKDIILFPKGNHRPNPNHKPAITFIMINNAFNTTRTGTNTLEFENELLYITSQITSETGEILGAATAAIPQSEIFKSASRIIDGKVAISIMQIIDRSETLIFNSPGWIETKPLAYNEKFYGIFKLKAHWIGSPEAHITHELVLLSLAGIAAFIMLLLFGLFALIYNRALNNDLEITRDAIIDLFRGKKPSVERFSLRDIADTYENIYDNLKNSAAITGSATRHAEQDLTSDSIFGNEVAPVEPVQVKSNFSRENYAMDVVEQSNHTNTKAPEAPDAINTQVSKEPVTLSPSIFRAYDIRGIYPAELNETVVESIGRAIGSAAIAAGTREITVARDGRTTGPTLIKALRKGLKKTGVVVIDIGMVPTPLLYFAAKKLTEGTGVMLTGSHNPPDYNGLKIMIAGETLYGESIKALYTRIETGDIVKGTGQIIEKDIMEEYQAELIGDIVLSRALKVVVDCGNGVTGVMMPGLLEQLGVEATGIFTEVDGTFPNHSPDPSQPKNMVTLIEQVKAQGADLGLAFDGDGDRVGVITSSGQMVYADKLMMLFAEHVLAANPGADIIYDVKCSADLADVIRSNGGRPIMWKTGHSLIKAKLRETNAPLAGEMSGHIFFNDRWNGYDDALYAAARLLEMLSSTTENLDELLAHYPKRVTTPELHVEVTDESKFEIIDRLIKQGNFGSGTSNEIDGLRVDFEKGWGLLRASNTTPVLVARFEAESEEVIQMIQGIFRKNLLAVAPDVKIDF